MATVIRYNRRTLPAELADTTTWPHFDVSALAPEELTVWQRRRDAVGSYLGGAAVSEIESRYGYQCHQIVLYLNRCVRLMDDGAVAGWIGLVKGIRTKPPTRSSPLKSMPQLSRGGYTGALEHLLSSYPAVRAALEKYLATGVDPWGTDQGRVTQRGAHQVFLKLCEEVGVGTSDWPFCVERTGRNSVGRYVKSFFENNHQRVALLQFGEASRDRSKRGKSPLEKIEAKAPLEIVEADEHEAHIIFSIGIDTPKGIKYVPCKRLTLIVIVDRFTSCILAWDFVVRRQIASTDFLECMDKAIDGQCLSSDVRTAMRMCLSPGADEADAFRVGFDSLFIDNALPHLSDSVCDKLRRHAGASVSFGAVRRPERRSLVEHVFSWMAGEVFHCSRATTGNNPVDTRRVKPEYHAVNKKVTFSGLAEAMERAVRRWNNRSTEANYGCSPNSQMLDYYSKTDGVISPVCPPRPISMPMRTVITLPTVHGSQKRGRAPGIEYAWVEYSSPKLAARWDLVGQKVRIHVDPYDVSVVHAYSVDGADLGHLTPTSSRWRHPHSLEMRRLLKQKIKYAHDQMDQDPIKDALLDLEQDALQANEKSPKITLAASIVAEEQRKGYSSSAMSAGRQPSVRPSTKQLAERIRKPLNIDFSVVGKE
ncbi:Mu transposase C-terminal domain-containing protein [Stenotrophomonas sp. S41]|uniref:Mu transposase C-terminal domain-containing protein n=1 Tax=Stenotrophomonas sp. S41 TaxID=2767464 RepID=UPI0019093603|nr:Mu transposase C-terminal domain-containing protein [Stenotrophomonas sp. S41]MBK0012070.1 Mu transposase C-terminal domain-containing protein [Stenotrophomonas sp. S41]